VPNPRECPRCKVRLDYTPKRVRAPKKIVEEEIRPEVRSKMSERLPWVAAAVIIIGIAAIGAWVLTAPGPSVAPSVTPSTGMDSWSGALFGTGTYPGDMWASAVGGAASPTSAEAWAATMTAPSA